MKAKLAQIFDNFISSGNKDLGFGLSQNRLRFINAFSAVGVTVFFVFSFNYFQEKNYLNFLIELSVGLIALFNLYWLRVKQNIDLASSVILLIMIFTLVFLIFNGGVEETGAYWLATFPVLAYFLKGKKIGTIWNGLFLTLVLIILLLQFGDLITTPYSLVEIRQLLASLVVVSLLVYFFQSITEFYEYSLVKSSQELGLMNSSLEKEVAARQIAQQKLEANLKTTANANQLLKDSKTAMLNVLEDERELEEQLKIEKASVEKKVEERTEELKKESIELAEANKTIEESILEIQEEKSRLDASISNLTLGFIMTDENNFIVAINKAAKDILGLRNQVIKIEEIEEKLKSSFSVLELSKKVKSTKIPTELKQKDFGQKVLDIFVSPIIALAKNEEFIGTVILLEDVTEEVVQNRSKDEFFSIASHELRTPLTAIRSYSALIRDDFSKKVNDKDFDQMISNVHESSLRLIQIVNDFLDVSKLEQNKIIFNPTKFSVAAVVDEVFKNVDALAKENDLKLNLKGDKKIKVSADQERLKQVLFNLIGNGIKFTKKGSVTVEVTKTSRVAKIAVTDTGKGIALANQKLLFKKLQQAEGSLLTRESNRATGLGLYISKLLVEGMGGEIVLEKSQVSKGTTFVFTLPLA